MSKKSRFFRVAVEGATSDGRTIDRDWLLQIAKRYSPQVYGARVNMEHIRGYGPNSDFRAYGDVLAVKTEEVDIGGQKKLALLAQIEATDELVELNKRRQKLYTSIEVRPSFADTGEAYLVGLAVTDNPASLGTEMLAFAAQNPDANPFKHRKEQPDDVFAVAEPLTLELEDESAGIVAAFKATINLVCIMGAKLLHDKYFPLVNTNQAPSETLAADIIISQKRVGGLQAVQVPFFPENGLLITTLDNLSVYWQRGGRRRYIVENPKRNRVEDYQSSNDDYVVEDIGLAAVVENIEIVEA